MASGLRLQSDPTRCKYPEDMPVGEERHIVLMLRTRSITPSTRALTCAPIIQSGADVDLGRGQPS
jgi:hypothetical protein